jgi:hypothetical protein
MSRLPAHLEVGALIRRTEQAGGFATVIRRGDRDSGALLLQLAEKGEFLGFLERVAQFDGRRVLARCGPTPPGEPGAVADYAARRAHSDPDLWIIELDIAAAERFAAETIALD